MNILDLALHVFVVILLLFVHIVLHLLVMIICSDCVSFCSSYTVFLPFYHFFYVLLVNLYVFESLRLFCISV